MRKIVYALFLIPVLSVAQVQYQPDAAHIALKLRKLNVLGSVLYVAAHPDDENTGIITQMSNGRLVETAYLSMTRGDGGQNLIGPEIRDLLGLVRTQELLAARRIDGGEQFFTRANDFGFSKSASETFRIWNKQEILSDVVKVFRQFQPDVIITRFPPDARAGHGHHTASAILAQEAFEAAVQPLIFPEQVKEFGIWQAKRLYTNTGRWWNTTIDENTRGILVLNVGGYSPLLGKSYSEIAAISRSQHKSQGFGSSGARGDQLEFLEFAKGARAEKDIFEGINISWSRIKNTEKIQTLVDKAIKEFDNESPASSIPVLLEIRKQLTVHEPGLWQNRKLMEVEQLIQDCLGLFIEATANNYWVPHMQEFETAVELVNRSNTEVVIERIQCEDLKLDSTLLIKLNNNAKLLFKTTNRILSTKQYSDPYWLKEPHSIGLFTVRDHTLIGKPENDPAIVLTFYLTIAGQQLKVTRPMTYKWNDRVKGEQSRPFEIVPPVFVNLSDNVFIFSDEKPREVKVRIKSSSGKAISGNLKLQLPAGWRAEPAAIPFTLKSRDDEDTKSFTMFPSPVEINSTMKVIAEVGDNTYDQSLQTIEYDHIPTQTLLPGAEATLVRINMKKEGAVIGYIKGAGDEVPSALRLMGYEVWEMNNEDVTPENLKRVDAVVLGIRAINVNDRLPFMMHDLLTYVKEGGTMVVQYNTNGGWDSDQFSPFPLNVSRDRVTDENAEVRFLKPTHPLLNTPNKITPKDFEGWVQERGLYFPNKWDAKFEAILSMNDKDEKPMDGSLLVARYGQGYYIYTGLSFFRELPEGVAGAYKLFANLVSAGKQTAPEHAQVRNKGK
ncbi:MAG: PIG-L family deacetylase [Cyclobacteriaceae bacterium]|nr:PIG-L family deacetylase [Cyclobacteriaceae bacterium]